jgi:Pyruvate/2-oxoacid:ferredoxin oxidoreductase delta subunit
MAAREGLRLINFEGAGVVHFPIDGRSYYLARPALEADLIINLPKLKTHVLTLMTGAVKNMFGIVPGFRKARYHKEAPRPESFAQILVDILSARTPDLTIIDAVTAMEGDGPSSGNPRNLNLLLASADPVAVDAIASSIIGLKADDVPTTKIASESGLGIGWPEAIKVVGKKVSEVHCPDFKLTSNRKMHLIPSPVSRLVGRYVWVRPAIKSEVCIRCNLCVDSCPTGALQSRPSDCPSFSYDTCINCWCCHEICPSKAVEVEQSWLAERFVK